MLITLASQWFCCHHIINSIHGNSSQFLFKQSENLFHVLSNCTKDRKQKLQCGHAAQRSHISCQESLKHNGTQNHFFISNSKPELFNTISLPQSYYVKCECKACFRPFSARSNHHQAFSKHQRTNKHIQHMRLKISDHYH